MCLQFIDGRLERLNSGEGFSDQFEEEINMGEYAGKRFLICLYLKLIISCNFVLLHVIYIHSSL